MPEKIKSVSIALDGQKNVYRPGELIKGYWELTSEKEFTTKGILSTFQGVAFVKWTETNTSKRAFEDDEFISYEVYTGDTLRLFGRGDDKEDIQPGVYKYPFCYKLPDRQIPSSYEGVKGAIRYFIQIRIRRPIPFPDVTRYKCITVLEEIDVNQPSFKSPLAYSKDCQIPKVLGLGNAGTVNLWGRIDRRAYCPGEQIALSVIAKNNSTQKLGKIKAQIMQYVTFIGNAKEEYDSNCIKSVQATTELEQGQVFKWTNMLIKLDGVPSTIDRPTCQSIRVHYYLEVVVPVSFFKGKDLKLVFPITIGTVPLGKSLRAQTNQSTGVKVYDASKAITYTSCNKGWYTFRQSSSSRNFPQMVYTPMCAYVVNYVFQGQSVPKAKPKQTTSTQTTSVSTKAQSSTATVSKQTPKQNTSAQTKVVPTSAPKLTSSSTANISSPTSKQCAGPQTKEVPAAVPKIPSAASANIATAMARGQTTSAIVPTAPPSEPVLSSGTGPNAIRNENQAALDQRENIYPPSYEEAVGIQDTQADEDSEEEESDVYYMVIRLTRPLLEELVTFVQNNKKCLEIHQGYLMFKSKKAYGPIGNWSKEKVVGMLSFPSKKQASDWLMTHGVRESKWLPEADVIITSVKEQYQTGKLTVTISEITMKEKEEKEAVERYRKLINDILKPIRILHGGLTCVSTPAFEVLNGSWRTTNDSRLSIMAWPDLSAIKKYKESISELMKTINELKEKCMVIHNSRSFDIEDFTETLSETETSNE